MIYAIRAVGTEYVKFGITSSLSAKARLESMQTGCPFELQLMAQANWPSREERLIHRYLKHLGLHVRGEWFRASLETEKLIECLKDGPEGLAVWHNFAALWARDERKHRRLGRALEYARSYEALQRSEAPAQ